jgi:YVTN family beta-propeller protein
LSRKSNAIVAITLALAVMVGCDSSDPVDDSTPDVIVVVANQGNFSDGNGSITEYDPASGEVVTILSQPNSIIQSLNVHDGLLYVAMNTGDRIDIVDVARGLVGQIADISSPRYMGWADEGHLLVSNLFDNTVSVVDVSSGVVAAEIEVGGNPEGVTVHDGFAYISNHGFGAGNTISVIDAATNRVDRTLQLACDGPRFVYFDEQNDMWVVCTGQTIYDQDFNIVGSTNGAVLVVDPASGAIRTRFDLDGMAVTAGPGQDAYYAGEAETLFVVSGGDKIVWFDTATDRRSGEIGPIAGSPIGAVAFDVVTQRLYIGQVPGFAQSGQVAVYDLEGAELDRFTVGIAPSHIEVLYIEAIGS